MTPNEKAEHAKQVLGDPVMKAAFEDIRMSLVSKLEFTPISDVETQHEIALMLQLLKRLREQLQSYVSAQSVDIAKQKQDSFIEKMRERFIA
jgi:hypothetical protein